ncbi:hypothetical protein EWE75_16995 [Sphingomonas populi]|uniref:PNPLA domain-containing protein n=1 Tax=Sphingomonas populi TaxID=2484750 RepID=A0A4Q6Y0Q6_9SPHN|nr:patatin-like phospholipase family protein [Sphingomonas populi]RZF63244.1 hypothetical protein EWE75_16995 [Sphingomonas populi]
MSLPPKDDPFATVKLEPRKAASDIASGVDAQTPQARVLAQELNRLRARRTALGAERFPSGEHGPRGPSDTVGIALSGGGIRSATISLGILRAMSRAGLIKYVDYISSVSGGSYIASFFCSRYVPSEWRGDVEEQTGEVCTGGTGDPLCGTDGERALDHLRQSGRHLLPGQVGDAIRLAVIATRSWLAVHLVLGVTLLAFFLLLKLPQLLWLTNDNLDIEADWAGKGLPELFWPSLWMRGYKVSHWFIASWLCPIAMAFIYIAAAFFGAYFLTRGSQSTPKSRVQRLLGGPGLWLGLLVIVAAITILIGPHLQAPFIKNDHDSAFFTQATRISIARTAEAAWIALSVAILALGACIAAEVLDAMKTDAETHKSVDLMAAPDPASPRVQEDRVRYRLTNWSTWCLSAGLFIGALALFDSIAQTIYVRGGEFGSVAKVTALLIASIPAIRKAVAQVTGSAKPGTSLGRLLAKFGRVLALLLGLLLAAAVGIFWATVAQWLAWWGGPIGSRSYEGNPWQQGLYGLFYETIACVLMSGAIAFAFSFLNLSTFANFYASSLRRAYLGASNVKRWAKTPPTPANRDHIDDDIALDRYYADTVLAPLHLINVTINDTASASSNTTQRDRKGKPLTVSPFGFLYPGNGVNSELEVIPHVNPAGPHPEKLSLSTWVGISGAAASTGMGHYGSLGLSLLAGLANLRLGYWWNPGKRGWRGLRDAVQWRLFDELTGKFPGSDGGRWYLTDGGHFEDTGAYELVRRRVGLIILCDNGGDPDYSFGDVVTLTRRIRIDFDADLSFVDDPLELDRIFGADTPLRHAFGTVAELGMTSTSAPTPKVFGPYAAIGRIRYDNPAGGLSPRTDSTLIVIKPRVCGLEAADLVAYARSNPPFPQQTTLDQTFDEAQWESYYRLGQIMGDRLFAPIPSDTSGTWNPRMFTAIDWTAVQSGAAWQAFPAWVRRTLHI